ncbi:hypothetical protein BD413DRAFT_599191, partial [Trametes elegans]
MKTLGIIKCYQSGAIPELAAPLNLVPSPNGMGAAGPASVPRFRGDGEPTRTPYLDPWRGCLLQFIVSGWVGSPSVPYGLRGRCGKRAPKSGRKGNLRPLWHMKGVRVGCWASPPSGSFLPCVLWLLVIFGRRALTMSATSQDLGAESLGHGHYALDAGEGLVRHCRPRSSSRGDGAPFGDKVMGRLQQPGRWPDWDLFGR